MTQFDSSLAPDPDPDPAPAATAPRKSRTQWRWTDAALKALLESDDLEPLAPRALARRVGMSEAAFAGDFPDHRDFLTLILQRLLDGVMVDTTIATQDMTPGIDRM